MRRNRVIVGAVALAALGGATWQVLRPPDPRLIDVVDVRRVEVAFEPWGEGMNRPPGAATEDGQVIAGVVASVRPMQEAAEHKCGSRGVIRFRRASGLPVELHFLPGHDPEWYEFRTGGKIYRVPRAGFVTALRRVGVEVPLDAG